MVSVDVALPEPSPQAARLEVKYISLVIINGDGLGWGQGTMY